MAARPRLQPEPTLVLSPNRRLWRARRGCGPTGQDTAEDRALGVPAPHLPLPLQKRHAPDSRREGPRRTRTEQATCGFIPITETVGERIKIYRKTTQSDGALQPQDLSYKRPLDPGVSSHETHLRGGHMLPPPAAWEGPRWVTCPHPSAASLRGTGHRLASREDGEGSTGDVT